MQLRNPEYLQVDYQYDQAGRLRGRVMSSGARSVYNYDANGWLADLTHYDAKNAQIAASTYSRDRVGNILTQVDTGGALPGTRSYTYDSLNRLLTADLPGSAHDEAFTYDSVGNRLTATKGALTLGTMSRYYIYTAGTNRLAELRQGSATGTQLMSFSYDDEGRMQSSFDNVTPANSRVMLWDDKGRLASLTKQGKTETYRYDPTNHRIARSGGALGNLDYFLEGEHLESVYSGGQVQAKYFRGGSIDELVAGYSYEGGKLKPLFFSQDGVSSTSALGEHNGGVSQALAYSPFGTVLASSGSSANRLKYTGREDDGTGLYYYRARYYDPAIGRFISEDPKGFDAGINFYAYVGNNPINANDPFGLDPYTSKYKTKDEAAKQWAIDTLQNPSAASKEYGAWVYRSQVSPERFSYTASVPGRDIAPDSDMGRLGYKQVTSIPASLIPEEFRNISVGQPSSIHSHPYEIRAEYSPQDLANNTSFGKDFSAAGVSSYTSYLLTYEGQALLSRTTNSRGEVSPSRTVWSVPDLLMPPDPSALTTDLRVSYPSTILFDGQRIIYGKKR